MPARAWTRPGVLVGSRHTAESLWAALGDPALDGQDPARPPRRGHRRSSPRFPARRGARGCRAARRRPASRRSRRRLGLGPRPASGRPEAIEHLADADGPRVVLVGKLIVSKGVDLLLAAWPLVHAANPGARLADRRVRRVRRQRSGAYGHRSTAGDLGDAREIAARGPGLEGGEEPPLRILAASWLAAPGYAECGQEAAGSVEFAGRLEHEEVGRLVPADRRPRLSEHLPRGVRHGRRRGGRGRRRCRCRRRTRAPPR